MFWQAALAVIVSVLAGELIKTITQIVRREEVHLFQLGGMPSTHSAAVAALVLSVYAEDGLSTLFLVTFVFGWIVLRDAYGVRYEVTRHSKALNKLLKTTEYQRTGHTVLEVIAGVILGLVVTGIVYLF